MRGLINNVIQWASDRDILSGSNPFKQLDKTSEELNELQRALAQWYLLDDLVANREVLMTEAIKEASTKAEAEVVDAYGDVLVTLIIAARMDGLDLEEALAAAWNTIKDRRGRLVDGKFVKEAV